MLESLKTDKMNNSKNILTIKFYQKKKQKLNDTIIIEEIKSVVCFQKNPSKTTSDPGVFKKKIHEYIHSDHHSRKINSVITQSHPENRKNSP